MADLIITASNLTVQASPAPTINAGTSGEAISQGDAVLQQSNGQWIRGSNNTLNKKTATGICMTTVAAAGQPVMIMQAGALAFGAILSLSTIYSLSANLGKIAPFADWGAGMDYVMIGYPLTTSNLLLAFATPGFTHP